ncbi:MAG: hypothetical protein HY293_16420 [Planctomycetes bacterium]|nr:hypothetical protein [Planctomycetota bacterium]
MNLSSYTRRLEACRKRWNRRTVRYVLAVARIIRAARRAAKDERRWGEWIRNETRMNRSTVYRYLRVAEFLKANVDPGQQLASLSIVKLYELSRLKRDQARRLLKNGSAKSMTDISFLRLVHDIQPRAKHRAIRPNLVRTVDSALIRLERSMNRWQQSGLSMPLSWQMKLPVQAARHR